MPEQSEGIDWTGRQSKPSRSGVVAGVASGPEPCVNFGAQPCARSGWQRVLAESERARPSRSRVESRRGFAPPRRLDLDLPSAESNTSRIGQLADCDHVPPCCVRRSLDRRRLASSSSSRRQLQLARSPARSVERRCTWRQRRCQQGQRSSRSGPRSAAAVEPEEYRRSSSSSNQQRHRRPPRPDARRQRPRSRHGQSRGRSRRDRSGRRNLLHLRRGACPVLVRRRVQPPHLPHVLDPPPRPLQEERVHFLQGRFA